MKLTTILTVISILFLACQKEVRLDLKNENNLIVDGMVTDVKGYNYIKLYTLQDYYNSNTSPDSISGALVTVSDTLGNIYPFLEKQYTHGCYCNQGFMGTMGSIYKLQIQYKNKTYESSCQLPPRTLDFSISFVENRYVEILFHLTQKDTNYYRFNSYINNNELDSLQWLFLLDGHNIFNNIGKDIFTYPHSQFDSLKIEEQSISKNIYLYYLNLQSYVESQEQPFNVPPVFPQGNISNGALGIFRASSIASKKIKF